MDRTPVSSSNVASVGYDRTLRVLELEFRTGRVYRYQDVHPNTARAMLLTSSKGKFVWRNIRNKYAYTRT